MALEQNIEKLLDRIQQDGYDLSGNVYLSLGKPNIKAVTKVIRSSKRLKNDMMKQCDQFRKRTGQYPEWVKVDVVTQMEKVLFDDVKKELEETRRNYVGFGIAFDEEWNLSFLPDVINANAFVKPTKDPNVRVLSEENINSYLLKYTNQKRKFSSRLYSGRTVIKFETAGYFLDDAQIFKLETEGFRKGLREVDDLSAEIDRLISSSTEYLQNEIQADGKFNYGIFSHFDRPIGFYNVLRHASSTYAMTEGLAYLGRDVSPAKKPLDYLLKHWYYEQDDCGYIFDDTNGVNEIKLGQNAAFIFAVCEYLKHFDNEAYLQAAEKVAAGMLRMIDEHTGDTVHVINYPDLSLKEKYRIIYYDGEAALALLRLYQINNDERLLARVKTMFERFIAKDYWKYHDHWLGYCTNELVQIDPDPKYIEFGIKNVSSYLDYMQQRETTFPTFLEMLMATYYLVQKAKALGYDDLVKEHLDEEKFMKTIHMRADYQRTGFFYPEVAMYFKNPARILGSFFIKHHGYRVRIDDIEHYISGYVQYQKAFKS